MVFYQDGLDGVFRFGDVVKGFVATTLRINSPILANHRDEHSYRLEVAVPQYSVVLTPCCSIGDGTITLSPLVKVLSSFFRNPYLSDDLLRIDEPMTAEQAIPPDDWKALSLDERERRMQAGRDYALYSYFVYAEHPLFERYSLKGRDITYQMIDFRDTQVVKCPMIKRAGAATPADAAVLNSKVLQLSIEARESLRRKLATYYARVPEEDRVSD